jgi:hypothetical protein
MAWWGGNDSGTSPTLESTNLMYRQNMTFKQANGCLSSRKSGEQRLVTLPIQVRTKGLYQGIENWTIGSITFKGVYQPELVRGKVVVF